MISFRRNGFLQGLLAIPFTIFPLVGNAGTPVTYTDDGRELFRVEVPDFWSLRTGGLRELADQDAEDLRDVSRVFGLTPKAHPGVWVGLVSPHGVSTLAQAQEYLRDIGPFLVKNAEVEAPKDRRIGGSPARSFAGQGTRNGKRVDFTALAIDLPNNRVAIAVVVFEQGADIDPVGDINAMLASIRAAR